MLKKELEKSIELFQIMVKTQSDKVDCLEMAASIDSGIISGLETKVADLLIAEKNLKGELKVKTAECTLYDSINDDLQTIIETLDTDVKSKSATIGDLSIELLGTNAGLSLMTNKYIDATSKLISKL